MSTAFETMTCADGSCHLHRYIFGIINYLGIDIKHHESMQVRQWRPLIMLLIYIYSCWLCTWFKSSAQVIFGIINYLDIDIKHLESMQVRHCRSLTEVEKGWQIGNLVDRKYFWNLCLAENIWEIKQIYSIICPQSWKCWLIIN